jgi:hypothetical protein
MGIFVIVAMVMLPKFPMKKNISGKFTVKMTFWKIYCGFLEIYHCMGIFSWMVLWENSHGYMELPVCIEVGGLR